MIEPCESALYNPAPGQQDEAFALFWAEHDLEPEAKALSDPSEQLPPVATVDPDPAELLAGATQAGEELPCTIPLRVFARQHPPLDAAHHHLQDRIDDQPHIQAAGTSAWFGRWDQFLDNDPLAVGQIGGVELGVHDRNLYHRLAAGLFSSNSFYPDYTARTGGCEGGLAANVAQRGKSPGAVTGRPRSRPPYHRVPVQGLSPQGSQ